MRIFKAIFFFFFKVFSTVVVKKRRRRRRRKIQYQLKLQLVFLGVSQLWFCFVSIMQQQQGKPTPPECQSLQDMTFQTEQVNSRKNATSSQSSWMLLQENNNNNNNNNYNCRLSPVPAASTSFSSTASLVPNSLDLLHRPSRLLHTQRGSTGFFMVFLLEFF